MAPLLQSRNYLAADDHQGSEEHEGDEFLGGDKARSLRGVVADGLVALEPGVDHENGEDRQGAEGIGEDVENLVTDGLGPLDGFGELGELFERLPNQDQRHDLELFADRRRDRLGEGEDQRDHLGEQQQSEGPEDRVEVFVGELRRPGTRGPSRAG